MEAVSPSYTARSVATQVEWDADIIRAANLLMAQYGEDATLRAAERADQLLEAGDMIGTTTWRRIQKAVEELQRGLRKGKKVN